MNVYNGITIPDVEMDLKYNSLCCAMHLWSYISAKICMSFALCLWQKLVSFLCWMILTISWSLTTFWCILFIYVMFTLVLYDCFSLLIYMVTGMLWVWCKYHVVSSCDWLCTRAYIWWLLVYCFAMILTERAFNKTFWTFHCLLLCHYLFIILMYHITYYALDHLFLIESSWLSYFMYYFNND